MFVPGGLDFLRFSFAHNPAALRDRRQGVDQLHGWSGESPLLASPSVSLSARGLPPSADSLPGRASATQALLASAAVLGSRWSGRGMSGCGG
jgi:hypothetical protein